MVKTAHLGAAAALALLLSAPAASPVAATIKDFDFAPMMVSIHPGQSVTWRNLDDEPHTVVSADGLFRSPALDQGDSFTFAKAGA